MCQQIKLIKKSTSSFSSSSTFPWPTKPFHVFPWRTPFGRCRCLFHFSWDVCKWHLLRHENFGWHLCIRTYRTTKTMMMTTMTLSTTTKTTTIRSTKFKLIHLSSFHHFLLSVWGKKRLCVSHGNYFWAFCRKVSKFWPRKGKKFDCANQVLVLNGAQIELHSLPQLSYHPLKIISIASLNYILRDRGHKMTLKYFHC